MGLTAAQMAGNLGNLMNDPGSLVWTDAFKFQALNTAQREVISFLMANGTELQHYIDLLSEIQEIEDIVVTSQGFVLSGLTKRTFLRNGFINSSIIDNDGLIKWPKRVKTGNLGFTANRFTRGTAEDPICSIFANKYILAVEPGSYPKTVSFYYVGEAKDISAIQNCELNPILHDIVVKLAEVDLLRLRPDQTDLVRIGIVERKIQQQLIALTQGAKVENQTHQTSSEFPRKQDELISNQQG